MNKWVGDENINFSWEPDVEWDWYDQEWKPSIKVSKIPQTLIDKVQNYVVNDASYSPDGPSISVWDEKKKVWKVLPVQGATVNNMWEPVDDTEWINDKIQSYFNPAVAINPAVASLLPSNPVGFQFEVDYANLEAAYKIMSDKWGYGTYDKWGNGTYNPVPQLGANHEDRRLRELFPSLTEIVYDEDCPQKDCDYRERANFTVIQGCLCSGCTNQTPGEWVEEQRVRSLTLNTWIIHLNDKHRWPRTEKDRDALHEAHPHVMPADHPTIRGWLQEGVEKYGWDLSCTLPVTGEEEK